MPKSTIVVFTFAESLQDLSDDYSEERSLATKVANHYPIPMTDPLLNTSRQNPRNTSHHDTRTNFLSVESSLTTSSVH